MRTGSSKLKNLAVLVCLLAGLAVTTVGQNPPEPPKPEAKPKPEKEKWKTPPPPPEAKEKPEWSEGGRSTEKALAVDPKINIKIPCILQARVTVNGWDRDEVRLFIKNGSNANFKVLEKDPKSGKPIWVLIVKQSGESRMAPFSDCLSGDRIDIEVPVGATISISGKETETRIDSIKKINLENIDGNVTLRNISGGIFSKSYKGDVSVENSAGQIALETTDGNVIAYGVSPGQVGDLFKVKTMNGRITLQNVEHRQIVAESVSGEVMFSGKFLAGGLYKMQTSAGSINLALPLDTSCRLTALYGGTFTSQIPFKGINKTISPAGNTINAILGEGASTVNLATHTGRIVITKF